MRKQGSLDGIILLVISFSVINYVVSKSVRLRQADTLFLCTCVLKKRVNPVSLTGEGSPETPSVAPLSLWLRIGCFTPKLPLTPSRL